MRATKPRDTVKGVMKGQPAERVVVEQAKVRGQPSEWVVVEHPNERAVPNKSKMLSNLTQIYS